MIRHLDPEGFGLFGTILADGRTLRQKPNHHSVYLPEGTVSSYRTVAPLWLGAESGLAVLAVSRDGSEYEEFYLDKAVCLKSGVWFRLTGFGGQASVRRVHAPVLGAEGQRPGFRGAAQAAGGVFVHPLLSGKGDWLPVSR